MTATTTALSPWACLDALSDHPLHGAATRCLHPALRHVHPIVKDTDEWAYLEIATYVAIAGGKELWIVPTSTVQRACAVREQVRLWAQACGHECRRPVWQDGCMVLRFTAVTA